MNDQTDDPTSSPVDKGLGLKDEVESKTNPLSTGMMGNRINTYYIQSANDCIKKLLLLRESARRRTKQNMFCIGFDLEYISSDNFKSLGYSDEDLTWVINKEVKNIPCILQFSTDVCCVVVNLKELGLPLPNSIVDIITNMSWMKFGVGISADLKWLSKSYNLGQCNGAVELYNYALLANFENPNLENLYYHYFGRDMEILDDMRKYKIGAQKYPIKTENDQPLTRTVSRVSGSERGLKDGALAMKTSSEPLPQSLQETGGSGVRVEKSQRGMLVKKRKEWKDRKLKELEEKGVLEDRTTIITEGCDRIDEKEKVYWKEWKQKALDKRDTEMFPHNWLEPLTKEQFQYVVADAYMSYRVGMVMIEPAVRGMERRIIDVVYPKVPKRWVDEPQVVPVKKSGKVIKKAVEGLEGERDIEEVWKNDKLGDDNVTRLQQYVQGRKYGMPKYEFSVVPKVFPAKVRVRCVCPEITGEVCEVEEGNKQKGKQEAAKKMLGYVVESLKQTGLREGATTGSGKVETKDTKENKENKENKETKETKEDKDDKEDKDPPVGGWEENQGSAKQNGIQTTHVKSPVPDGGNVKTIPREGATSGSGKVIVVKTGGKDGGSRPQIRTGVKRWKK